MIEGFRIWLLGTLFFVVLVAVVWTSRRSVLSSIVIFAALAWCLGIPVVYAAKVLVP